MRTVRRVTMTDKNTVGPIAVKALRNSFIFGLIGFVICSLFSFSLALGFVVGFLIGIANLFLLYSAAMKSMILSPEQAKRKMLTSYPFRFLITLVLMGYMVWSAKMSPVTLLAGYIVTLMSMVGTAIYMSFKDKDFEPQIEPIEEM
jgi:hypothetical protein